MGVRDLTTLAQKSVILVNTDVAASQQVADRYCAMYGIPLANQFTYAMGSAVVWPYAAGRYAGFWTDLKAKVDSVDAYAVFTTAGCPVGLELQTVDELDSGYVNFSLLVGFVKRIIALGYAPYAGDTTDGFVAVRNSGESLASTGTNHKTEGLHDQTAIETALQLGTDADYLAAGGTTGTEYQVTTYKSGWNGDYSIMDNLLTGHIGYYTEEEATHSASLWDLSRVILGKAGNLQIPTASQSSRVALVCPWTLGSFCHDSTQALIGKKLVDLGLDVKCWYRSDTPSALATSILPETATWTTAQLTANTASPDYTSYYSIGSGFDNGQHATWNTTMIPQSAGGVFCGGASYGHRWGKQYMVDAGQSYVAHIGAGAYGWHQSTPQQGKEVDIWLNLIAGRTLAEAAWCGLENTFLAVGDPLARPFV